MLKHLEMSDPLSCLNKASEDEPVFVFRAQDVYAPGLIREWAHRTEQAQRVGSTPYGQLSESIKLKLAEAYRLAESMEAWQTVHGSKVGD